MHQNVASLNKLFLQSSCFLAAAATKLKDLEKRFRSRNQKTHHASVEETNNVKELHCSCPNSFFFKVTAVSILLNIFLEKLTQSFNGSREGHHHDIYYL